MTINKTVDIIGTMYSNVLGALFNLYTIEFSEDGISSKLYMSTNSSNELLADFNGWRSNCKIINLSTNVYGNALKLSMI